MELSGVFVCLGVRFQFCISGPPGKAPLLVITAPAFCPLTHSWVSRVTPLGSGSCSFLGSVCSVSGIGRLPPEDHRRLARAGSSEAFPAGGKAKRADSP